MARSRQYLFWDAITYFDEGPKVIVDIGSIKSLAIKAHSSYGYSVLAWLTTEANVYSIDTDPSALVRAGELIKSRLGNPAFDRWRAWEGDGAKLLTDFAFIDILYIDGPGEEGSKRCVEIAADPGGPLRSGGLLLLDDCDLPEGRDGRRNAVRLAVQLGFKALRDTDRQVLLVKP